MKYKCVRCKKEKEVSEFAARNSLDRDNDSRTPYCKACRMLYHQNPLEYIKKKNRRILAEVRRSLREAHEG